MATPRTQYNRDYAVVRRVNLRNEGICLRCSKRKARVGQTICGRCSKRQKAAVRAKG